MTTHPLADSDEELEYRRPGFRDRFLVVHPVDGFVMSFTTKQEAMEYAVGWDRKSGYQQGDTEVFDRFSKYGNCDTWRLCYAASGEPTWRAIHVKARGFA